MEPSKWDKHFLDMTDCVPEWSKDPSTKTGGFSYTPDYYYCSTSPVLPPFSSADHCAGGNTFTLSTERDLERNLILVRWMFRDRWGTLHQSQCMLSARILLHAGYSVEAETERTIVHTFHQLLNYLDVEGIDYSTATVV